MTKIFLDTDVIIDFLTKREPFALEILEIFQISSKEKLELKVSSLTISNVHYILSRIETPKKSIEKIKALLQLVKVLNVDAEVVEQAINSNFIDFEDALQNFCAQKAKIKSIITRNVKDYKLSQLAILTPKEFLIKKQNE